MSRAGQKAVIIKNRKSNNNSSTSNKIPLYLNSVNNSRRGTASVVKPQHARHKTVTPKILANGSNGKNGNTWATSSQI